MKHRCSNVCAVPVSTGTLGLRKNLTSFTYEHLNRHVSL